MLDGDVARTRSELAGKERQKAQMGARKLDTPHLAALNTLYKTESALAHLEMERDLARKIYLEVATTYETARLTVAGRSSALQIVTPADVPDRPISRGAVKSAVLAFFVGLLSAAAGVLLYNALSPSLIASRPSHTV
jgi:capsule polysaccharide export protein KpsE/RkpR